MTTKKPPLQEEEIDLGNLFQQIGNMFKNLFRAIGNFFAAIYHYFILFLLFIRRNIIPIGIVTLIGIVYGLYKDYTSPPVYESEMIVKTNFGSATLLYEKIDEINALLAESDTLEVAKLLDIPPDEVGNILSFSIEPNDYIKDSKLAYDKFRLISIDTSYTNHIEYEDFIERYKETDAQHHRIIVFAQTPKKIDVGESFKKLVHTDFFINLEKESTQNFNLFKERYTREISAVDSIRDRYKKVAFLLAKNPSSDASLKISTEKTTERNVDYDLFNMTIRLLKEYDKFTQLKDNNNEALTVVSDFSTGKIHGGLRSSNILKYGVLGLGLILLILFALHFNKYLSTYEKELSA